MNRDFEPMAKAEYRAETTGQLIEEGATPLSSAEEDLGKPFKEEGGSVWSFILPLVTLDSVGIWGLWHTGGGSAGRTMSVALGDNDDEDAQPSAGLYMPYLVI